MFALRTLEMMSLLSVVFMVYHVIGDCSDCVSKDGKENQLPLKTQRRNAARIVCGKIGAVVDKHSRSSNYSHNTEDDEDEYEDAGVDNNTDSDLNMAKIMGGRYAQRGEVPWHATIMLDTYEKGDIPHCGAAILSEYWILTAAHCFYDVDRDSLFVLVGDHTRNRKDQGQQSFGIRNIFTNENYRYGSADYNLAMVNLLSKPGIGGIQFNHWVQPVCLPNEKEMHKRHDTLRISGMGLTSNNPSSGYTTVLKRLDVTPWPCSGSSAVQTSRIFCLGSPRGATICRGDNGAPAVKKNGRVHVLYGIVAYDAREGCQGRTFVANVYEYRNWITDAMRYYSHPGEGVLPSRPN